MSPTDQATTDAGDWLPARIHPVRGESFSSFCRRLAAVNGLTVYALKRTCIARYPNAAGLLAAIACCIGSEPAALKEACLPRVRAAYGNARWQLTTTEWLCPSCSAAGIEDELRGVCVQFFAVYELYPVFVVHS
jgi:hypothetical protein